MRRYRRFPDIEIFQYVFCREIPCALPSALPRPLMTIPHAISVLGVLLLRCSDEGRSVTQQMDFLLCRGKTKCPKQTYKPGSVSRKCGTVIIHLALTLPSGSSDQTRRLRTGRPQAPPYLVLLRMGFTRLPGHPDTGGLLPHHFTVTPGQAPRLCLFCGTFLPVTGTSR